MQSIYSIILITCLEIQHGKIPLKAAHVINNFVQAVLELIQVTDLSKEQQKMGVYCVDCRHACNIDPKKIKPPTTVVYPSIPILFAAKAPTVTDPPPASSLVSPPPPSLLIAHRVPK
jgi:hypothetical protein